MKILKKLYYGLGILSIGFLLTTCDAGENAGSDTGTGGSLARFAVTGNTLYTVTESELLVFDVTNAAQPVFKDYAYIGAVAETIFPYGDNLFIGTQTGMYIFDVQSPQNPELLSIYTHVTSCDPVVVQGDYAYVTLRSGNTCRRGLDQLDVVNISDLSNPVLETSYGMTNPFGLGVSERYLFVCDGVSGLRVMEMEDPVNMNQIHQFPELTPYDVIPMNGILILVAEEGLFQYRYFDGSMELLSEIRISV